MRQFYKYYTAQVDEMDCGVACLSMILKCYGTKVSLARLRDLAKTDLEGTTALGLVKAAQKLSLRHKLFKLICHYLKFQSYPIRLSHM